MRIQCPNPSPGPNPKPTTLRPKSYTLSQKSQCLHVLSLAEGIGSVFVKDESLSLAWLGSSQNLDMSYSLNSFKRVL